MLDTKASGATLELSKTGRALITYSKMSGDVRDWDKPPLHYSLCVAIMASLEFSHKTKLLLILSPMARLALGDPLARPLVSRNRCTLP